MPKTNKTGAKRFAHVLCDSSCKRWTVKLLAEELVRLEMFESVSPATVHRTLKKASLSLI